MLWGESEREVYGRRIFKDHWTPEAAAKALELLKVTGNPYLDLCMSRGGFPSRKRQYCTQYLKTEPLVSYCDDLLAEGFEVESWQSVRANESASRAKLPEREEVGGGLSIFRPILRWTVEQVFARLKQCGIEPNPLYKQGMRRVGCMPCINASHGEVLEIASRFPEHVKRIAEWERLVESVRRPGSVPTFFHASLLGIKRKPGKPIYEVIRIYRARRGSLVSDDDETPKMCSSAYGLCE